MRDKNEHRKALVVGAHCDDAVLRMGGTIHSLKNDWEWHITSLCDGNAAMSQSFYESCKMLGVKKCRAFSLRIANL